MPKKDASKRPSATTNSDPLPPNTLSVNTVISPKMPCPCNSNQLYTECCHLLHQGVKHAVSAEQLMRSRYSAHACGEIAYLVDTTLPVQQAYLNTEEIADWANRAQWTGLSLVNHKAGQTQDDEGWVEFIASYNTNNEPQQHRENAYFKKLQQRWYFVHPIEGLLNKGQKVSRNEPCPCGSERKYKKCCG